MHKRKTLVWPKIEWVIQVFNSPYYYYEIYLLILRRQQRPPPQRRVDEGTGGSLRQLKNL